MAPVNNAHLVGINLSRSKTARTGSIAAAAAASKQQTGKARSGSTVDFRTEFEMRTRYERVRRYIHKGMRREKWKKIFFLAMNVVQMVVFFILSLTLSWIVHGGDLVANPLDWTKEEKYYSAVIDLGGFFAFLLSVSGTLRANTFEIIASLFAAMLAAIRVVFVVGNGFKVGENPKRCASLIVVIFAYIFFLILSGILVIRSFGWELYLKIGSHKHLRRSFREFLLFSTCMELDVIFVFYLAIAGAAFFFDVKEQILCWICVCLDCAWSLVSYIVIRRETYERVFSYPFLLGVVLVPGYLIYKIIDVTLLRPDRDSTPTPSLVMSAVMALILRLVVGIYGIRCKNNFGIGLSERLDEIGMMLGDGDSRERRIKYKRDKEMGVNTNRQKQKAMAALGAISGNISSLSPAGSNGRLWVSKSEEERRKELQEIFNMFDADGSGSIDEDELFIAMKTMGQHTSMEEVTKMIAEMDEDGNGDVDFDEFFEMMNKRLMEADANKMESQGAVDKFISKTEDERRHELRALFDKFDADGSGNIDADEMHTVLKEMGVFMSLDEVLTWVCEVDEDQSGTIDFDEFVTLLTNKLGQRVSKAAEANGTSKLNAIQAQLMAAVSISGSSQATSPDSEWLLRLQQYDSQRLKLMAKGFPAEETMALAKLYREVGDNCKTDKTKKLALWWAKDLVDRLLKQKDSKGPTSPLSPSPSPSLSSSRQKAAASPVGASDTVGRKRGSIFTQAPKSEIETPLTLKTDIERKEKQEEENLSKGLNSAGNAGVC